MASKGARHDRAASGRNTRTVNSRALQATLTIALVAGCSQNVVGVGPQISSGGAIRSTHAKERLFVANFDSNEVGVYNASSGKLRNAISQTQPLRLVFGDGRTLFVATDQQPGEVAAYSWGSFQLLATIHDHIDGPRAMVYANGKLYVGNSSSSGNWISVYAPPDFHYVTTFGATSEGIDTIAAAADGDIYVAELSSIRVYDSTGSLTRTITDGVSCPNLLNFDRSGDLYVANFVENQGFCSGNIYVYPPRKGKPKYVISSGLWGPVAMIFDSAQNLYVANGVNSTVAVYPLGQRKPSLTISKGLSSPTALAVSAKGDLYVASDGSGPGWVTMYSPGAKSPRLTITDGISVPVAVAIK